MNWTCNRLFNIFLFVLFSLILVAIFLNTSGCAVGNVCQPGVVDTSFGGTWGDSNVELTVGHVSNYIEACNETEGLLYIHGVNTQTAAVWDRLAFSGNVTKVGSAKGDVSLWLHETHVANFELELTRTGDQISFDLNYTANNQSYQEHYQLQKIN